MTVYRAAVASWYGPGFYGRKTACGQRMTRKLLGVAHKRLPCGTEVALSYGGRSITVPVVDRGPFVQRPPLGPHRRDREGARLHLHGPHRRRAHRLTPRVTSSCAPMRLLNATRARQVADAVIRDPEEHTTFDEHGAVRSIQAADLTMPEHELDAIWSPMHLERLARTYWKYLSRVTLGLIRVAYTPTERYVVLITRPFVLLRFRAPEYSMDDERGMVRWRIRDGILVASEGHEGDGYLEIDVTPLRRAGARAARGCTSRSRSRRSTPRSRSGSRAGSTPTRSRASTCSSPTASCARSRSSSSRSPPSAASPTRPAVAAPARGAEAGHGRRHAVGARRRARRDGAARARAAAQPPA